MSAPSRRARIGVTAGLALLFAAAAPLAGEAEAFERRHDHRYHDGRVYDGDGLMTLFGLLFRYPGVQDRDVRHRPLYRDHRPVYRFVPPGHAYGWRDHGSRGKWSRGHDRRHDNRHHRRW